MTGIVSIKIMKGDLSNYPQVIREFQRAVAEGNVDLKEFDEFYLYTSKAAVMPLVSLLRLYNIPYRTVIK